MQVFKRTVLSDSLESELMKRARDGWKFEVRETTCADENCNCEIIGVQWFGHGLVCSCCDCGGEIEGESPLVKVWLVEEVTRRKDVGDFAQSIIDQITRMKEEEDEEDWR